MDAGDGGATFATFLAMPAVDGIAVRTTWASLEPSQGAYDWSTIDEWTRPDCGGIGHAALDVAGLKAWPPCLGDIPELCAAEAAESSRFRQALAERRLPAVEARHPDPHGSLEFAGEGLFVVAPLRHAHRIDVLLHDETHGVISPSRART